MVRKLTVKDFTSAKEIYDDYSEGHYFLERSCIIFHKHKKDNAPLVEVSVHENIIFQNCIPELSDYLIWLGIKCKKALIKYFNENMIKSNIVIGKKENDEWYKKLECYYVAIDIDANGELMGDIGCIDRGQKLDIKTKEKEIVLMEYWKANHLRLVK
jgi:hypothetical protein